MLWPILWALAISRPFFQVQAQTCLAGYEWENNDLLQSPCQVATLIKSLAAAQSPESNTLTDPPTQQSQNSATCSGIYYTLVAACQDCQNHPYVSWSQWSQNCNPPFPDSFGGMFIDPQQVHIPTWVTDHVAGFIAKNDFDPSVSTQYLPSTQTTTQQSPSPPLISPSDGSVGLTTTRTHQSLPTAESPVIVILSTATENGSVTVRSSTVTRSHSTSSGTNTNTDSNTPTDSPSGESSTTPKKKKNLGAIIGGAVGGFLFLLGLTGFVLFMLARRKRARIAPSAAYLKEYGEVAPRVLSPRPFSPRNGLRSSTPNGRPVPPLSFTIDSQDRLVESLRESQLSIAESAGNTSPLRPMSQLSGHH